MPTPDLIQGVSLPTMGDAPAVPTHLSDTWYAAISRALPRFASEAARNAAYPSPTRGQACVTVDTDTVWYRGASSWVRLFQANTVYRREVLTGTGVITAAGGVTFGTRIALIDYGSDGSKAISLAIEATAAPYTAGVGNATWGTVASALVPPMRAPAQFVHSTNLGLGQIDTGGVLSFRWGTFASGGSTSLSCTANYVIPAP